MKRTWMVVMLVVSIGATGCSWVFQERLRGGIDNYTARSEPRCSSSKGWAIVDGVLAGLHVATLAAIGVSEEPIENRGSVMVGNGLWAVVHIASAVTGSSWASECSDAYDQWAAIDSRSTSGNDEERKRLALEIAGNHLNDPRKARAFWCAAGSGDCVADQAACVEGECSRQESAWCTGGAGGFVCNKTRAGCLAARYSRRSRNLGECLERRAELAHLPDPGSPASPVPMPPAPATPAPRGYYCASSAAVPNAGFCTREKEDCQRARQAATAAIPDLDECQLVEAAFCHVTRGAEQCAPTLEACAGRRSSALDVTVECEPRK